MILWSKSRSTTTGQSRFIEQYWKAISGVVFVALALGYARNILKTNPGGINFNREGDERVYLYNYIAMPVATFTYPGKFTAVHVAIYAELYHCM